MASAVADCADPLKADTAAEFMTQLHLLRAWKELSMEQISRRTAALPPGQRLATSTVSDTPRRRPLPKWVFVESFVIACGIRRPDVVNWETAWRRIKVAELLAQAPNPDAGLRSVEREMDLPTDEAVEQVQEAANYLQSRRAYGQALRTDYPDSLRIPRQPGAWTDVEDDPWAVPTNEAEAWVPPEVVPDEVPTEWMSSG